MDKFKLIETFSNKQLFEKNTQTFYPEETEYRITQKGVDRNGRTKSYLFRARRTSASVSYVCFFLEDPHGRFLVAKIFSEDYLRDCIRS